MPVVPTVSRPRKKRYPEAELLARLKKYEAALKSYGADIEAIQHDQADSADRFHTNLPSDSESSMSPSTLGPSERGLPSDSVRGQASI